MVCIKKNKKLEICECRRLTGGMRGVANEFKIKDEAIYMDA
jgi:hypothetical protein